MSRFHLTSLILLITTALLLAPFSDAEAKRFGGGRSFGGKPFYTTPYKRSQLPPRSTYTRQKVTPQSQTAQRNQATRQSWRQRGGLMGWLAPLLIGGLLGSLFFGGAFEHLNLADFLIFGGLAFLALRFLGRGPRTAAESSYGASPGTPPTSSIRNAGGLRNGSPFDTDLLFGRRKNPHTGNPRPAVETTLVETPVGFDMDAFLKEAKRIFLHLQDAWNRGEIADIRELTTDDVFVEIKSQRELERETSPTEVLELNARLLDYQKTGAGEEAAVLFTALIHEGNNPPEQVQEVWHFMRPERAFRNGWLLDGIQQLGN